MALTALDGTRFAALVCGPEGGGPGIVLLSCSGGIDGSTVAWCERYADEGYVVIAPDQSRHYRAATRLKPADLAAALGDAYVAKSALAAYVNGPQTGFIGIGPGAAIAWRAAVHGAADACVIYGAAALALEAQAAANVSCPTAVHVDNVESHSERETIAALRAAADVQPRLRLYEYPRAGADFFEPSAPGFERHSTSLAHSRSLAALRPVLGPHYDLARLFADHLRHEFVEHDPDATMATMVAAPYVNHVPTLTGGVGHDELKRFYRYHFIPNLPADRESVVLSETVGADTVVLELVTRFTHDREIDYLIPGIAPTGKVVEVPTVVIAKFRGGKLYHEHIYWDQASVLVQLGLLESDGLPVSGAAVARKMLDQNQPANELMPRWITSEGKPI